MNIEQANPVESTQPAEEPIQAAAPVKVTRTIRVWDLPTRGFHWLLVVLIVGLFITGKVGGNAMIWHMRLGLAVGALLIFRLVWGLVGGRWSRFASFIYAPSTVINYLRGQAGGDGRLDVGHSPTGALSVFALLGVLAFQVATGLVADDEIATTGPLYAYVSSRLSHLATEWHEDVGQVLLIALVLLHIAAIVFYAVVRKKRLVPAMWHGDKEVSVEAADANDIQGSRDGLVQRALALVIASACVALAVWVDRLGVPAF